MRDQREQIGRGKHFDIPRPGRLGALRFRADQSFLEPRGMDRGEQDSGRRRNPTVESQFPHRNVMRQRFGIDRPDRGKQTERDRQVEMRPFLGQIGGRQIDGDDLGRKREANCGQGTAHAFPAFRDCLVG